MGKVAEIYNISVCYLKCVDSLHIFFGGVFIKTNKNDAPVNGSIKAANVLVIGPKGEQLGQKTLQDAITLAQVSGFDLVQVGSGETPTCRLMDYNKFKYEKARKQKESYKKQKENNAVMKMYRLRPYTDKHDFETKVNNATKYAIKGHKIKVDLLFRNREIVHSQTGKDQLLKFAEALSAHMDIETMPKMEGRRMHMILTPKKDNN